MNEHDQTEALAVIDEPMAVEQVKPSMPELTPAQARIDAVANVLHKAYEKAAILNITPEEAEKLTAPFADEDFRTGAGGKENLIYIEHASLRDRLNSVLGVGQWAIIVRNRWAEDISMGGKPASRVYADVVLLIRGAFAAEAIGDMVYYPHNQQTNYGDAVEGAKSAALRRCAKDLGIGLQAWHKDFCEGWMSRNRGGNAPSRPATPSARDAAPTPMAAKKRALEPKPDATKAERDYFVKVCEPIKVQMHAYMVEKNIILETEGIEDCPLDKVPRGPAVRTVIERCCEWSGADVPEIPDPVTEDDHPDLVPAEVVIPEGAQVFTGFLKMVKEKPTSKGGTNYSLLLVEDMDDKEGGIWVSTFSDTDGETAKSLQGEEVNAYWTPDKTGKYKNLCENGISPTA